jgi:hypothetical protein
VHRAAGDSIPDLRHDLRHDLRQVLIRRVLCSIVDGMLCCSTIPSIQFGYPKSPPGSSERKVIAAGWRLDRKYSRL